MRWVPPWFIAVFLAISPALAHEGHDHAEAAALPQPVDQAPRFEAASEEFELVGEVANTVAGQTLTLYLDRYASNEPVAGAVIEVEAGPKRVHARESSPGVYRLALPDAKPGRHPLVFTIQAGATADLLTANLELPSPKPAAAASASSWSRLAWAGLALPLVGLWFWRRRTRCKD